jgi:hypothetical protein
MAWYRLANQEYSALIWELSCVIAKDALHPEGYLSLKMIIVNAGVDNGNDGIG